jgi:hypothetical protein
LLFAGASAFFLASWFGTGGSPINWRAILTIACAVFAVVVSAQMWKKPSRVAAIAGLACVLVSVLRVGLPSEWTGFSFVLFAITVVLSIPLVHAAIVLKE